MAAQIVELKIDNDVGKFLQECLDNEVSGCVGLKTARRVIVIFEDTEETWRLCQMNINDYHRAYAGALLTKYATDEKVYQSTSGKDV